MEKISSKITKKIVHKTDKYNLGEGMYLIVQYENKKIVSQTLTDDSDLRKGSSKYSYLTKGNVKDLKNVWFPQIKWGETYGINKLYEFKKNGFDFKRVYRIVDGSCHLVFKPFEIYPVNGVYYSSYIGGFQQRNPYSDYYPDWEWDKLVDHLKNHECFSELEVEEIPYYDRDFLGQKAIKGFIHVPEEAMKNIWDRVKGEKFPSSKAKDLIQIGDHEGTDFLEVSQFIKS